MDAKAKKIIPLVIIALLAAWYLMRPGKAREADMLVLPSAHPQSSGSGNAEPSLPSSSASQESGDRSRAIRKAGEEIRAGLKRVPVQRRDNLLQLQIRSRVQGGGCLVGDFDLLKSLSESALEKIFLVSVEEIESKSSKAQSLRTSLAELDAAKPMGFRLPIRPDLAFYGVYICTSSKNLKKCGNKSPMTPKDWKVAARGSKVLDKTIHFQMIATRGEDVYLLPGDRWNDDALSHVQELLTGDGGSLEGPFKRLKTLLSRHGSLNASVTREGLELNLPYRDPNCD